MPTVEEILQRAAAVGWQPENQQVWLERKGFSCWEDADEETRRFALKMIEGAAEMFGIDQDEISALREYDH